MGVTLTLVVGPLIKPLFYEVEESNKNPWKDNKRREGKRKIKSNKEGKIKAKNKDKNVLIS